MKTTIALTVALCLLLKRFMDCVKLFQTEIIVAKIIVKKFFKSNVQKMSIEGASDFRVSNNNFLP